MLPEATVAFGVILVIGAVLVFFLRGSVPVARILIPVVGTLVGGLTLLGVLPLPQVVASFSVSLSFIVFFVLNAKARKVRPLNPKA